MNHEDRCRQETVLVHASDLHIGGTGFDSEGVLQRFVDAVALLATEGRRIDAVLVTGDLTQNGRPDEYRVAHEILKRLRVPVIACIGNHDDRSNFASAFLGVEPKPGPTHSRYEVGHLTVFALDTQVPGQDHGTLGAEVLDWLSDQGGASTDKVVIALHHSPITQVRGLTSLDERGLRTLHEIIARLNVRIVVGGHFHNTMFGSVEGAPVVVAPSLAPRISAPWEATSPCRIGTPGFALHVVDRSGAFVTYLQHLD